VSHAAHEVLAEAASPCVDADLDEGAEGATRLLQLIDIFKTRVLANQPSEKDADLEFISSHQSKGLQWPIVAVANDFDESGNFVVNQNERGGRLDPNKPYWFAATAPRYRYSKSEDDGLNLLYVALTRATDEVRIVRPQGERSSTFYPPEKHWAGERRKEAEHVRKTFYDAVLPQILAEPPEALLVVPPTPIQRWVVRALDHADYHMLVAPFLHELRLKPLKVGDTTARKLQHRLGRVFNAPWSISTHWWRACPTAKEFVRTLLQVQAALHFRRKTLLPPIPDELCQLIVKWHLFSDLCTATCPCQVQGMRKPLAHLLDNYEREKCDRQRRMPLR
jgi:hypothetical protein